MFGGLGGGELLEVRASEFIVNPGKLEHGFWRINAGIPYTLP